MNDELWTRQANALYFREVWHILTFKRELDSVIKKKGKLRRDILRRELETLQVSIEDLKISCIRWALGVIFILTCFS